MLILPAIDLRRGTVVRLRQGDYAHEATYAQDPAEVAASFVNAGFRHLHVVDLDGAREGRLVNGEAVQRILNVPGAQVELGGGLRDRLSIDRALALGVWRVMIGSAAVRSPGLVHDTVREVGGDRIAIAVDMRHGRLAVSGWTDATDDTPEAFIRACLEHGVRTFHCTDVLRDGMLQGPNVAWYGSLHRSFPDAELIAAGGISSIANLDALRSAGVHGAVIGRALYEGAISLASLNAWVQRAH